MYGVRFCLLYYQLLLIAYLVLQASDSHSRPADPCGLEAETSICWKLLGHTGLCGYILMRCFCTFGAIIGVSGRTGHFSLFFPLLSNIWLVCRRQIISLQRLGASRLFLLEAICPPMK